MYSVIGFDMRQLISVKLQVRLIFIHKSNTDAAVVAILLLQDCIYNNFTSISLKIICCFQLPKSFNVDY